MKKLLVPTDYSPTADKAFAYALSLAKKAGAEILLLHCMTLPSPPLTEDHEELDKRSDELERAALRKLDDYKLFALGQSVQVQAMTKSGTLVETIIATASEYNADFIVMGTLGTTGLNTMIFGTHTAAVIARSSLPVIAVPSDYNRAAPNCILLAVENVHEDPAVFKPLIELANVLGAEVKTLTFSDDKTDGVYILEHAWTAASIKRKLETSLAGAPVESVHVSGSDFHQTLQQYIREHNIDLLVMITHKRSFLQNLFHFSMTRQMAYHTEIPLLSLQSRG
ncbi:MAG TPA: universal stress protein [Flavisolibacter sp.]